MRNFDQLVIADEMAKLAGRGDFAVPLLREALHEGPGLDRAVGLAHSDPTIARLATFRKDPNVAAGGANVLDGRKQLALALRAIRKPAHMLPDRVNPDYIKGAATAPGRFVGGGTSAIPGMGGTMATIMHGMQESMAKSPLENTSMNFGNALGGAQAMLSGKTGIPQASLMNNWVQQLSRNKNQALF
jgi:hypothetical protein